MTAKICGFTLAEIDAATCYLTCEGMRKLRPCRWALNWMRQHRCVKVTPQLFRFDWASEDPHVWLLMPLNALGPVDGWPWSIVHYKKIDNLSEQDCLFLARHLKAYIMLKGEGGCYDGDTARR